jgi:hypothetical protein
LRGMSREEDRVIFCVMGFISATGAERLSFGYQPVTKEGAALFLSLTRSRRGARRFWREDHAALCSSEGLLLSLGCWLSCRNPRMYSAPLLGVTPRGWRDCPRVAVLTRTRGNRHRARSRQCQARRNRMQRWSDTRSDESRLPRVGQLSFICRRMVIIDTKFRRRDFHRRWTPVLPALLRYQKVVECVDN